MLILKERMGRVLLSNNAALCPRAAWRQDGMSRSSAEMRMIMTSRERVRAAMRHEKPDRIPAAFEAVESVTRKLLAHYGFRDYSKLVDKFGIDIVPVSPIYTGPARKTYYNEEGKLVKESFWGYEETYHDTETDTYPITTFFPFNHVETLEDVERCVFPNPDWFDYSVIKEQCNKYPDKAIIVGHEGPFQIVTFLMEMDKFFMLMYDEPEAAKRILDRMVAFELEYYKRIFEAAGGRIDILRVHDDYGTQISLLFGVEMWKTFFEENTRKLTELAHRYGAFYQQHSCGAVGPLIPELIRCKVDALEPLQKVNGLEPEFLRERYEGQITFHGGIDTQHLLPYGTPAEVEAETGKYMELLGRNGGYILMASQSFEGDVPIPNIEALYGVKR